jgi:predicted transcriptional regulator
MTAQKWKNSLIADQVFGVELYTVIGLQKSLFALGHNIPIDDLYSALKGNGWIKLRLIRDRLLETKRQMPKHTPFDGVRHLIKYPLLVDRDADLPEWKKYNGSSCIEKEGHHV